MQGFGCLVLAHDLRPNPTCEAAGVQYVSLEELLQRSDMVSLNCPLLPSTKHLLDVDRYHLCLLQLLFCCQAPKCCHACCLPARCCQCDKGRHSPHAGCLGWNYRHVPCLPAHGVEVLLGYIMWPKPLQGEDLFVHLQPGLMVVINTKRCILT